MKLNVLIQHILLLHLVRNSIKQLALLLKLIRYYQIKLKAKKYTSGEIISRSNNRKEGILQTCYIKNNAGQMST